jgi:dTDP-4-dehydrorhamnose reductase
MKNNLPILILGATGMVGTAVEEVCSKRKVPYVALAHSDMEISDFEKVTEIIDEHKPEAVINCVAIPNIDSCEKSPEIPPWRFTATQCCTWPRNVARVI